MKGQAVTNTCYLIAVTDFVPQSRGLETLLDVDHLVVGEGMADTLAKLVPLSAYRSFFNKASKPLNTRERKSGGERTQNGTEKEVKKTSRTSEEENMEDSCRHQPVTDSSESPVLKRKSKRRRVIVDSDDDVGEEKVEEEVGDNKVNGREEGGEEEREGSEVETSVCGTGAGRKGEDEEMELGEEKGTEEEEETEEERIEGKVEEKGKTKLETPQF